MSILFGKRYRFTSEEIVNLTDLKFTTVRSQLQRLCQKGIIKHVSTLPPRNTKVYSSDVDPLTLIGQGRLPAEEFVPPPSTYLNNPFNLYKAIDMRWRNEDLLA